MSSETTYVRRAMQRGILYTATYAVQGKFAQLSVRSPKAGLLLAINNEGEIFQAAELNGGAPVPATSQQDLEAMTGAFSETYLFALLQSIDGTAPQEYSNGVRRFKSAIRAGRVVFPEITAEMQKLVDVLNDRLSYLVRVMPKDSVTR